MIKSVAVRKRRRQLVIVFAQFIKIYRVFVLRGKSVIILYSNCQNLPMLHGRQFLVQFVQSAAFFFLGEGVMMWYSMCKNLVQFRLATTIGHNFIYQLPNSATPKKSALLSNCLRCLCGNLPLSIGMFTCDLGPF